MQGIGNEWYSEMVKIDVTGTIFQLFSFHDFVSQFSNIASEIRITKYNRIYL